MIIRKLHAFELGKNSIISWIRKRKGILYCLTQGLTVMYSYYWFSPQAIGKHCNELQTIGLSECESLTPQGITSLVTKCCHLTSIDVKSTNVRKITIAFLPFYLFFLKCCWSVRVLCRMLNGHGTCNVLCNTTGGACTCQWVHVSGTW